MQSLNGKIFSRILRRLAHCFVLFIQTARIVFYRLSSLGTKVIGNPIYRQPIYCRGSGVVNFGEKCQAGVDYAPGFLTSYCYLNPRSENSKIIFGNNVVVNNGFTAVAERCSIVIGDRVLIGTSVTIYDSDFHGLTIADRNNPDAIHCDDVLIGNDVFIGSNVTILKGVKIGNGAVIGAGSLVSRDVPPNAVVSGNPAKVIRFL